MKRDTNAARKKRNQVRARQIAFRKKNTPSPVHVSTYPEVYNDDEFVPEPIGTYENYLKELKAESDRLWKEACQEEKNLKEVLTFEVMQEILAEMY